MSWIASIVPAFSRRHSKRVLAFHSHKFVITAKYLCSLPSANSSPCRVSPGWLSTGARRTLALLPIPANNSIRQRTHCPPSYLSGKASTLMPEAAGYAFFREENMRTLTAKPIRFSDRRPVFHPEANRSAHDTPSRRGNNSPLRLATARRTHVGPRLAVCCCAGTLPSRNSSATTKFISAHSASIG
jgi:hypothetical protein